MSVSSVLGRVTVGAAALAALLVIAPSSATSVTGSNAASIDFTSAGYTVADQSPTGQNGWRSTWTAGHWFDWAVVDTSSFPDSGLGSTGRALRHSNAIDNIGQWANINQLFAPDLAVAAGDGPAYNDIFDTTFVVASATGDLQERLATSVNIDNGTGGRGGNGITLLHGATGLQLGANWVDPSATDANAADWRTYFTPEYDATVPHTIRIVVQYVPGDHTAGPDTMKVYLDGELVIDGYTYEGYHDAVSSTEATRISDTLLFRASRVESLPTGTTVGLLTGTDPTGPQLAALDGQGFLYTDISYATYKSTPPPPTPSTEPLPATGGGVTAAAQETLPGGATTFEASGFDPYENVAVTIYSTPYFAGWFRANASGVVAGSFTLPHSVAPGSHTLQVVGQNLGRVALSSFRVGLPETGADFSWPVLFVGGGLLGAGALLFTLRARTLRARRH
ncbi:hypothetical protein BH10ACT7_BH10ACT7_31330 [soil metagenome]